MATDKFIKCEMCSWKRLKFYRGKDGKLRTPEHAWTALEEHMMFKHPLIYLSIQKKAGNEEKIRIAEGILRLTTTQPGGGKVSVGIYGLSHPRGEITVRDQNGELDFIGHTQHLPELLSEKEIDQFRCGAHHFQVDRLKLFRFRNRMKNLFPSRKENRG